VPDLFAENAFFVHTEKAFYTVAFLATGQTTQQKSATFFLCANLKVGCKFPQSNLTDCSAFLLPATAKVLFCNLFFITG